MKMTKLALLALVAILSLLVLTGCSEDDSIAAPDDETEDSLVVTTDNGDGTSSTVVNAGMFDATEWVYMSFADGEVEVTDPATETNWDLRFKFYTIQLNGGFNGSAGVEIAYVDGVEFADATTVPTEGYVTDADGDDAFKTDGGWYTYNPQTHETVLNGRIWFVHLPDDSYLKMELDNLSDDAGTPGFPGFTWMTM
ncbi:MAG: hypothetical protein GY780_15885 [bacterium]|nr:hypothetical protein [bacterium]